MLNKKGDLSLSTNAIVVLIIAIVMLGLALAFVKGMFSKVANDLEQQISNEPDPGAPNSANPITLSKNRIVARIGDEPVLKVGMFCANSAGCKTTGALKPTLGTTCTRLQPTKDASSNDISCTSKEVDGYNGAVSTCLFNTGTVAGKEVCSISVGSKSVDIIVELQ